MSTRSKAAAERRDRLVERLGSAGRRTSDVAVMFHTALSARAGVGVTDWKILGLLENHGPLGAGELAQLAGLVPASITTGIDRLEDRGLVRREKDPRDGRRVVVVLEESALEGLDEQLDGYFQRLKTFLDRYTDDQLETIADFLEGNADLMRAATTDLTAEDPSTRRSRRPR